MLRQTPKNYGSLGHGKRSPQKNATVTKFRPQTDDVSNSVGPTASGTLSCAVCVVGQLARLELESKVRHVVEPNLRAGHTIALLMVLSQGTPKYVNGRTGGEKGKIRLTDGPFALADERQLQASVWSKLDSFRSNASNSASRFSLRISLEAATNLSYPADLIWAKHLDKADRGINASLHRQQLHILQWTHLRTCMFLVDAEELSKGTHLGLVLKLREDSFALQPWLIPSSWAQRGLTSLHCLEWGGVMDSVFAVGRRWAWAIMEGLAADWYISHYALTEAGLAIPHNPESWIARLAKLKHVPVQRKGLCELPFLSVRFVNHGPYANEENTTTNFVVKRLHYQAARHDDRCWSRNATNPVEWRSGGPIARSRCAGSESMRKTLLSLKICPVQLCLSR